MQGWSERYTATFGHSYAFDGGKDGAALKKLLPAINGTTVEDFLAIAERAWKHQRTEKFAKATKQSATIHGICKAWNEVRAEIGKPSTQLGINFDGTLAVKPGQIPTDVSIDDFTEA